MKRIILEPIIPVSKVQPKILELYQILPFKIPHYNKVLNRNLTWFEFVELSFKLKLRYLGWLFSKNYIKKTKIDIDLKRDIKYSYLIIDNYKLLKYLSEYICSYLDSYPYKPTHILIGRDYYEKIYNKFLDRQITLSLPINGNIVSKGLKKYFNLEVIFCPDMNGLVLFNLKEDKL